MTYTEKITSVKDLRAKPRIIAWSDRHMGAHGSSADDFNDALDYLKPIIGKNSIAVECGDDLDFWVFDKVPDKGADMIAYFRNSEDFRRWWNKTVLKILRIFDKYVKVIGNHDGILFGGVVDHYVRKYFSEEDKTLEKEILAAREEADKLIRSNKFKEKHRAELEDFLMTHHILKNRPDGRMEFIKSFFIYELKLSKRIVSRMEFYFPAYENDKFGKTVRFEHGSLFNQLQVMGPTLKDQKNPVFRWAFWHKDKSYKESMICHVLSKLYSNAAMKGGGKWKKHKLLKWFDAGTIKEGIWFGGLKLGRDAYYLAKTIPELLRGWNPVRKSRMMKTWGLILATLGNRHLKRIGKLKSTDLFVYGHTHNMDVWPTRKGPVHFWTGCWFKWGYPLNTRAYHPCLNVFTSVSRFRGKFADEKKDDVFVETFRYFQTKKRMDRILFMFLEDRKPVYQGSIKEWLKLIFKKEKKIPAPTPVPAKEVPGRVPAVA